MERYNSPLSESGAVLAGSTVVVLRGPNPRRTNLIISAPLSGRITLGFRSPAALDQGITLYAGANPLYLSCEHVGHAIREDVYVIASSPGTWVGFIDVFWPQDVGVQS